MKGREIMRDDIMYLTKCRLCKALYVIKRTLVFRLLGKPLECSVCMRVLLGVEHSR